MSSSITHHASDVNVSGRSIEVARWEPAAPLDPPIVLLHEGLGSVAMWRDFPEALAARSGHAVMAYSRPGTARPTVPAQPHTIDFMHEEARALPDLLDACAIDHAILFGHSDGGSIAIVAAARTPARVQALVLEAPHVFVEDVSIASIERTTASYRSGDLRARLATLPRRRGRGFPRLERRLAEPGVSRWNLEAFLPSHHLSRCSLIQGEDDEYGTLAQLDAIERRAAGRVERLVLPRCGHSPHRDRRDDVLAAVQTFVSRVS